MEVEYLLIIENWKIVLRAGRSFCVFNKPKWNRELLGKPIYLQIMQVSHY